MALLNSSYVTSLIKGLPWLVIVPPGWADILGALVNISGGEQVAVSFGCLLAT